MDTDEQRRAQSSPQNAPPAPTQKPARRRLTPGERLERLSERIATLREEEKRLRAQEASAQRKARTRRQIIAGGLLFAMVEEGDEEARTLYGRLLERASSRDRAFLEKRPDG